MKFRKQFDLIFCLIIAIGIFLLVIAIAKGNFLILAGPVALWVFTVFITLSPKPKTTKKASRLSKSPSKSLSDHTLLTCKAVGAVVVLIVAMSVWLPKLRSGVVSDKQIGKAMEEANVLFQSGYVEEAILRYHSISIPKHLTGRNAEKYHNLGALMLQMGKTDQAYEALQKAVMYDPEDSEAYYFLARIAYGTGDHSKSLSWLKMAKELGYNRSKLDELEIALKTEPKKQD